MSYDVIVLGLGAMGSAAAYHLAARGKRVLGVEKFGAAHAMGSSHGESRIIRQAYFEHASYVPLLRRSYQLWRRLEQDSGMHLFERTGGLMIGPSGSPVVEGAIASAREHGLAHQVLEARETMRRFPAFRLRSGDAAMYEEVAGYLRPEEAIRAHLRLAEAAGAELHFDEPVADWTAHVSGEGVTVTTSRTTYQAERLVVAAGAWAPRFLSELGVPFDVRRHVMCWFKPISGIENFQPEHFPVFIWDADGANIFYGFPAIGQDQAIKVAMHSGGAQTTADALNREVSASDVQEVRSYLEQFIPLASGVCERTSVCMYTLTPDEHFVVAPHPAHPQVAIAAGFSGHGFKFSAVIGEILSELTTDGRSRHPIEFLSPERFRVR